MRIKIKKIVLGAEYTIYVRLELGKYECKLWTCGSLKEYSAEIDKTFTKIDLLEEMVLAGYDDNKTKEIKEIKLSKENSLKAKDYILI